MLFSNSCYHNFQKKYVLLSSYDFLEQFNGMPVSAFGNAKGFLHDPEEKRAPMAWMRALIKKKGLRGEPQTAIILMISPEKGKKEENLWFTAGKKIIKELHERKKIIASRYLWSALNLPIMSVPVK